jgi:uncharacterized protein (DUF305 family)
MMTDRVLPVAIMLAALAAWAPSARQNQSLVPLGGGHMPMPSASLPGECPTQAQTPNMQAVAKNPDIAFICGVIPHYRAAIDLAQVSLKTGEDAEARTFAERVIRDQGREIAGMEDWLRKYAVREGRR